MLQFFFIKILKNTFLNMVSRDASPEKMRSKHFPQGNSAKKKKKTVIYSTEHLKKENKHVD